MYFASSAPGTSASTVIAGFRSFFSNPVVWPMNPGTFATWSCTSMLGTGSCFAEKSNRVK